jgi:hypothetical protein
MKVSFSIVFPSLLLTNDLLPRSVASLFLSFDLFVDNLLLAKEDPYLRGKDFASSRQPSSFVFPSLFSSSSSSLNGKHKSLFSFLERKPDSFTPPPVIHHGKDELPHRVPPVIFSSSHIESVIKQPPVIQPVNPFMNLATTSQPPSQPQQGGDKAAAFGNFKPDPESIAKSVEYQNQQKQQQLSEIKAQMDNNKKDNNKSKSKNVVKNQKIGGIGKSNKKTGITYNSVFYQLDPAESDGNLVIGKFLFFKSLVSLFLSCFCCFFLRLFHSCSFLVIFFLRYCFEY